jgi:membrane fusion protein (multidrug efflux system)
MSAKPERSDPHGHLNLVAPTPGDEIEQNHAVARAPAAKPEPAAQVAAPPQRKAGGGLRRRIVLGTGLIIVLAAAGWYGEHWWTVGRFRVSTDDAYVYAHNTTLAAKVPGYVAEIRVADNARVHAGDVIASIDDGDYRLAVDQARDKAGMVRADLELTRQQTLASRDFASRQALEAAQANRDQARAAVTGGKAALEAAQANVEVTRAQEQEAQRALAELRTALAKAERDLRFTQIRAPIDGVIGNRAIQVGDYVQTGQRLASLVPLDEIYIDANFKETQLAHLRPGQKVAISVDALPDQALEGTVDSLAPASGAVFSLLPPDNATGNFTKIVQRLPVRVRVPTDVAAQGLLRPGMSVVVSVNTKPTKVADGDAPTPPRMAMPRVSVAQGAR